MNHPDLYFPSHTPESTAQNKGKNLCSSFTSLAQVASSTSALSYKGIFIFLEIPSQNNGRWDMGISENEREGMGEENQLAAWDTPAFWWKRQRSCDLHLPHCWTEGRERTGQGHGSETELGFASCSPTANPGLELSCRGGKKACQILWT